MQCVDQKVIKKLPLKPSSAPSSNNMNAEIRTETEDNLSVESIVKVEEFPHRVDHNSALTRLIKEGIPLDPYRVNVEILEFLVERLSHRQDSETCSR